MASEAIASISVAASPLSFRRSAVKLSPSPPLHVLLRPRLPLPTFALKRSPKRLKYASQRQFNKKGEKMLYVEVDPLGADTWKLEPVIELIKDGGVGVIPTDTVACGNAIQNDKVEDQGQSWNAREHGVMKFSADAAMQPVRQQVGETYEGHVIKASAA